ncbi:MAG TPA: carboxypeptidase-like regulatory domain-containing protein [Bryobacteraceae bacterium]|nr:carboxypeptidase-like regulatory domain-containing protein [Bryobacteraceae bacterium]
MRTLAILCLLASAVFAQEASLALAGRVVDSESGEPIPRAVVTLNGFPVVAQTPGSPAQAITKTAVTDQSGVFSFSALPEARYSLNAQKAGFANIVAAGGLRPTFVELKSSTQNVVVRLAPLGVITGKVVDDDGEPMRGVGINAISSTVENGQRVTSVGRTVNTDDRGMYRLWNLMPGRYYLKATGQGGGTLLFTTNNAARLEVGDSFAPTYSGGGKTMEAARPVEIAAGTRATADFHLKLEPAFEIRGTVRNFTPRIQIAFGILINGEEVGVRPDRFNAETGAFQFNDVVSGSYILRATQGDNSGEVAVNIAGADAANVALTLYPRIDIPVTTHFLDAAPANVPHPQDDPDDFEPGAMQDVCNVWLNSDRRPVPLFTENGALHKVQAGQYRVSLNCLGGYVRSALAGTQDLLLNPNVTIEQGASFPPIEILAVHGGGNVTASLPANLFSNVRQIAVLLVPKSANSTGPQLMFAPLLPGGTEGSAHFGNLAPGEYTLYAFANPDIEYASPAFLSTLSGGVDVEIEDSAEKKVTIDKVIP